MTAALNIILGCLLLLTQAGAAFTPHVIDEEPGSCRCCACGVEGCAVPQSAPTPAPAPIAVQRISAESEVARQPAANPVSVPVTPADAVAGSISFHLFAWVAVPPLYRQHCALLI